MSADPRKLLSSMLVFVLIAGQPALVEAGRAGTGDAAAGPIHPVADAAIRAHAWRRSATSIARMRRLLASRATGPALTLDVPMLTWPPPGAVGRVNRGAAQAGTAGRAGRNPVGPIAVTAAGVALFAVFLARGSNPTDEMNEPRGTGSEATDFAIFAGALTLIGAGVVMLISGS